MKMKRFIDSSNYSISYINNINVGKASVTIDFNGETYTGNKTLNFTINPQGTELTKLTTKPAKMTVKWEKKRYDRNGESLRLMDIKSSTLCLKRSRAETKPARLTDVMIVHPGHSKHWSAVKDTMSNQNFQVCRWRRSTVLHGAHLRVSK